MPCTLYRMQHRVLSLRQNGRRGCRGPHTLLRHQPMGSAVQPARSHPPAGAMQVAPGHALHEYYPALCVAPEFGVIRPTGEGAIPAAQQAWPWQPYLVHGVPESLQVRWTFTTDS